LKVTLIERYLPHYRLKFCEWSRERLAEDGIEFSLVYGQPNASESKKKDTIDLPWARKIENVYLPGKLVYQPCWKDIRDSDLIIIEQANKLLINYLLFGLRPVKRYKLGFIGHGYCHQQSAASMSNRFKRLYTNAADWWFAYTDPIADFLAGSGFPREHITVMENSIDTREMIAEADAIPAEEVSAFRRKLGLDRGPVGLFCGGMYKEKEMAFLLEACRKVKAAVPGFSAVFLGDGPDGALVRQAAAEADWIHFPGPKFGREKVMHFLASDVFLMPGLVGLAILDCFAMGLPLLTTDNDFHSPEIAYLRKGGNGMMTKFDLEDYSGAVIGVLRDPALLSRLKAGSLASRGQYSMENMVDRFCEGVKRSLASP
jgi:glycosyltransferase involved in cell wall biosynthesis